MENRNEINPYTFMSDDSRSSRSYETWSYGYSLDFNKPKTRHKFSPILLIFSTVHNCEKCGAKKEDCTSIYCEDEMTNLDIGGL